MIPPVRADDLGAVLDEASSIVRSGSRRPGVVETKRDGSPVTSLDREVDAYLRSELSRLLPGAAWLSEESPDDGSRRDAAFTWIVDPIDGTKELIAGRDEIAISIALIHRGDVVAAAVANPLRSERGIWVAGGSPRFEGLAQAPAAGSLADTRAIVSRTEWSRGDLRGLEPIFGETRPVGSVAYKLLRVAAGADHLTYSVRAKREWDVGGGFGLVRAAGGTVLRLDEDEIRFNREDARFPCGHVAGPHALVPQARREILFRRASR